MLYSENNSKCTEDLHTRSKIKKKNLQKKYRERNGRTNFTLIFQAREQNNRQERQKQIYAYNIKLKIFHTVKEKNQEHE